MNIRKIESGQDQLVLEAAVLFDETPHSDATARFLASDTHHLFIAYEGGTPAGFVTAVEMTHPDKGTELFLYELGVDEKFRRQGIGSALVEHLREFAKERGCYGMWVLVDNDNEPALATYRKTNPDETSPQTMLGWKL